MNPINSQTPGPVRNWLNQDLLGRHPNGIDDLVIAYLANTGLFKATETQRANARLLAAGYTAFDKAGRELGVDAAELAEKLDLTALINAALAVNNARLLSSRDVRVIGAQVRLSAALAPLRPFI